MFKKAVAMMALPVALGITFHAQAAGLSKADPVALEVCTASLGIISGNPSLVRFTYAKTPHWLSMQAVSAAAGKVQTWECLHNAQKKTVNFRNPCLISLIQSQQNILPFLKGPPTCSPTTRGRGAFTIALASFLTPVLSPTPTRSARGAKL